VLELDWVYALTSHDKNKFNIVSQLIMFDLINFIDDSFHLWISKWINPITEVDHLVIDVLHDKVELMRFAPNTKKRTIVMHKILKSGHNVNNTLGHISSSVRRQTKKANLPIMTK